MLFKSVPDMVKKRVSSDAHDQAVQPITRMNAKENKPSQVEGTLSVVLVVCCRFKYSFIHLSPIEPNWTQYREYAPKITDPQHHHPYPQQTRRRRRYNTGKKKKKKKKKRKKKKKEKKKEKKKRRREGGEEAKRRRGHIKKQKQTNYVCYSNIKYTIIGL